MRIIILLFSFLPITVLAYPVGTSIGWGTGHSWTQASFDQPIDEKLGQVKTPSYSSVNNQDLPWAMYAGFRYHEHYGIELGYLDYGSIKFSKTVTNTSSNGGDFLGRTVRNARISTQGYYISHVLYFQLLNSLQLQAKAGVIFGNNEYGETGSITTVNEDSSESTINDFNSYSESFAKGQLALGLLYKYQKNWRLRLQVNQIEFSHPNESESFSQWFTGVSIERRL